MGEPSDSSTSSSTSRSAAFLKVNRNVNVMKHNWIIVKYSFTDDNDTCSFIYDIIESLKTVKFTSKRRCQTNERQKPILKSFLQHLYSGRDKKLYLLMWSNLSRLTSPIVHIFCLFTLICFLLSVGYCNKFFSVL